VPPRAARPGGPRRGARAPEGRAPTEPELRGAWRSRVLRGPLTEFGHTAIYVFGPDGAYTGALVSDVESTPIAGTYRYADGVLILDDGALEFRALRFDDRLELDGEGGFLALEPLTR
jgi:hypothetical protein